MTPNRAPMDDDGRGHEPATVRPIRRRLELLPPATRRLLDGLAGLRGLRRRVGRAPDPSTADLLRGPGRSGPDRLVAASVEVSALRKPVLLGLVPLSYPALRPLWSGEVRRGTVVAWRFSFGVGVIRRLSPPPRGLRAADCPR